MSAGWRLAASCGVVSDDSAVSRQERGGFVGSVEQRLVRNATANILLFRFTFILNREHKTISAHRYAHTGSHTQSVHVRYIHTHTYTQAQYTLSHSVESRCVGVQWTFSSPC